MTVGRPIMIRQPQYMHRPTGMPMAQPPAGQMPQGYQDQGACRPQIPGQPFVQYGSAQPQQHAMTMHHPGGPGYGKPGAFSPGGHVSYVGASADGSTAAGMHFVSMTPGQGSSGPMQRYPAGMQPMGQQPGTGVMSPPMMQRIPGAAPMTPTYGAPTTMQQYQRAMPPQQYATAGMFTSVLFSWCYWVENLAA